MGYTDWWQAGGGGGGGGGGREAQTYMEETDGERLPWVEVHDSLPSRKQHLEIRWDLLCVQLASYLEGGPLMWMMPLHLHVDQKSDNDDLKQMSFI